MIFAFADGGTLHKYLQERSGKLTRRNMYELALAISNGLEYMHDHDIIHKDLVLCVMLYLFFTDYQTLTRLQTHHCRLC